MEREASRDKGRYVLLTCFQVLKRKFPEFHYDFLKSIPPRALNTNIHPVAEASTGAELPP